MTHATKALTDIAVRNLKPSAVRREIPDRTPYLYVIVQPSGRRRFCLRYRFNGDSRKVTLTPGLSLAAARKVAADAALDLERGIDPREQRKEAKRKATEAKANTLAAIVAEFLKRHAHLRSNHERERLLRKHILPVFGERPIGSIRRGEIVRLLDKVEDRSGTRTADVVLSILMRVCRWHAVCDETFTPPFTAGMRRKPLSASTRSRVLSDDELRKVWHAAAEVGTPGAVVRLLLLTGARRSEAAEISWGEVTDGVWILPASRNKTQQELVRPLSRAALAILEAQPRLDGCPYVFTLNGAQPVKDFIKPKRRLDAASGVNGWVLHDLRRTARSLLSRAGVNVDVAERCLGHVPSVIRRTYDRHHFLPEMRHAYEALAAQIERIIDPQENVIALRGTTT
jgi:integrase